MVGGKGRGERYKECRREYKELCERKRKEENERWMEVVRQAKTEGRRRTDLGGEQGKEEEEGSK